MSKTWFSPQGQEIIVENLVSGDIILNDEHVVVSRPLYGLMPKPAFFVITVKQGDIILNDEGREMLFQKKRDVIIYYFKKLGFGEKRILINSLSTPLFILTGLPGTSILSKRVQMSASGLCRFSF